MKTRSTLSIVPAPGIEPATSSSAVKRSTDWANPVAVGLQIKSGRILDILWAFLIE